MNENLKLKTFRIDCLIAMFINKSLTKCVPITVTKLTNVINMENYLLMLVIWEDRSNCLWRLQKFHMWMLWKIIYSSWLPKQTHKYHSLRSQRFQMWLLWKIFPHVGNIRRHIKTVHDGHKDYKCLILWKIIYLSWFCKRTNISNVTHMENYWYQNLSQSSY